MIINRSFKKFKLQHRSKKNQIIYSSKKVQSDKEVLNLIDNFLIEKNSFIFESVEKGKIKGRYTIIGLNPDKIWDINNNVATIDSLGQKKKIKIKPLVFINKLIKDFNIKIPKQLPSMSSMLVGYFSYDVIRYIEKIPDQCKDDLKIPDVRLMRPKTIIIHDNEIINEPIHIINYTSDIDEPINWPPESSNNEAMKYLLLVATQSVFPL